MNREMSVQIEKEVSFDNALTVMHRIADGNPRNSKWIIKKKFPNGQYINKAAIPHEDVTANDIQIKEVIRRNENWGGQGDYIVSVKMGSNEVKEHQVTMYVPKYDKEIANIGNEGKIKVEKSEKNDKNDKEEPISHVKEFVKTELEAAKMERDLEIVKNIRNKGKDKEDEIIKSLSEKIEKQQDRTEKLFQMMAESQNNIALAITKMSESKQTEPSWLERYAIESLTKPKEDPQQNLYSKLLDSELKQRDEITKLRLEQLRSEIEKGKEEKTTFEANERMKILMDNLTPLAQEIIDTVKTVSISNKMQGQREEAPQRKEQSPNEVAQEAKELLEKLTPTEAKICGELDQLASEGKTAQELWDHVVKSYTQDEIVKVITEQRVTRAIEIAGREKQVFKELDTLIKNAIGG